MRILLAAVAVLLVLALGTLELFAARSVPDAWLETPQADLLRAR
jgi:hypothetical protein